MFDGSSFIQNDAEKFRRLTSIVYYATNTCAKTEHYSEIDVSCSSEKKSV